MKQKEFKMSEVKSEFNQLCVWPATLVEESQHEEFETFMKSEFGARVKIAEVVLTNPDKDENGEDIEGTGGRSDVLFYIHSEDIPRFAVARLAIGIRWWEDALSDGGAKLYASNVLNKYKRGW